MLMKKTVLFALVLVLVLSMISGLALAEDSKWPVRDLTGTAVQLKPGYLKTTQEQSYAGPGRGYALSGSFRPYRVNKATALLREGDYVLVDLDYATAKRVVYFAATSLVSAEVKEEKLEGVTAKTNKIVWPVYYGPGKDYDIVTQRARSKYADMKDEDIVNQAVHEKWKIDQFVRRITHKDAIHWVGVDKGASVTVFFQTGDWVYVETRCSIGNARFWLPADAVE
jgi:hypothetical protein